VKRFGKNDHSKLNPLTKNQLDLDKSSLEASSIYEINDWGKVGTHPKMQQRASKESSTHREVRINKLKEEEIVLKQKAKRKMLIKTTL
jgi:hypothetical protein